MSHMTSELNMCDFLTNKHRENQFCPQVDRNSNYTYKERKYSGYPEDVENQSNFSQ